MKLISECGIRFKGIPTDIYRALTDSASLPLEEQPDARRAVRDGMLRLLAAPQQPLGELTRVSLAKLTALHDGDGVHLPGQDL
jgi:hypothetical protein